MFIVWMYAIIYVGSSLNQYQKHVVNTVTLVPGITSYLQENHHPPENEHILKLGKVKGYSKSRILMNIDISGLVQRVYYQHQHILDAKLYFNCLYLHSSLPGNLVEHDVMVSLIKHDWSELATWQYRNNQSEKWSAPYLNTHGLDAMFTVYPVALKLNEEGCSDFPVVIPVESVIKRWLAIVSVPGYFRDNSRPLQSENVYGLLIWMRQDHQDTGNIIFASKHHPVVSKRPWLEVKLKGKLWCHSFIVQE